MATKTKMTTTLEKGWLVDTGSPDTAECAGYWMMTSAIVTPLMLAI
jgi:hypothetical protein